jgi:hypothetical protein
VVIWGPKWFKTGYSCESQTVTVCQDFADSLDKAAARTDMTITDFEGFCGVNVAFIYSFV